ncbi:hypothetical protein LSH36_5g00000 [Paralvinella palmiformis]|uniref:Uncharacterized protein n=1 Tax=Paralvinella palmiformis TaxID=53620 RepID=A0AAD9KDY5_9ANNE|nr:hypothetical protein LSH36_5g00000 [Paralvinella palmiformis]
MLYFPQTSYQCHFGLESVFSFICSCKHFNRLATDQRHAGTDGQFNLNTKSALGNKFVNVCDLIHGEYSMQMFMIIKL